MEEMRLPIGADGVGTIPSRDHATWQRDPSRSFYTEHGIKTSGLRSSPHPLDYRGGEDYAAAEQDDTQSEKAAIEAGRTLVSEDAVLQTAPAAKMLSEADLQAFIRSPSTHADNVEPPLPSTNGVKDTPINGSSALWDRSSEPLVDETSLYGAPTSLIGSEGPRIEAFAKLEFDDGQFYMNTYAVELGRDIRAARKALQRDLKTSKSRGHQALAHNRHQSSSSVDTRNPSLKGKRRELKKTASSVLSESGGILNYSAYDSESLRRSKNGKSMSEGSISNNSSSQNPTIYFEYPGDDLFSSELPANKPTYGAQPVNASALMPSPDECPLIPIHPPVAIDGTNAGHRGISRRHVKIAYNFEKRLFEMEVKGRNGAFVDEQHFAPGEVSELRNGSFLQIGGVGIRFRLPRENGTEGTQTSGAHSAMSFDFEDGRGESIAMADTSESASSVVDERSENSSQANSLRGSEDRSRSEKASEGEASEDDGEIDAGSKRRARKEIASSGKAMRKPKKTFKPPPSAKVNLKSRPKTGSKSTANPGPTIVDEQTKRDLHEEAVKALELGIPISMIPPRRKGPGRPPKNGFMSKREEASLKKQAREVAKAQATINGDTDSDALKTSLDIPALMKRKYTKRKGDGQPDETDIHESIEGSESVIANQQAPTPVPKPSKEKRPKPAKSPSPIIDEASLTSEQLAKPQQSYVVLIHEALTNAPTGQMSLPQIYKAIERRYPYFKFKVQTVGWQSSIRHNLSQHPAFRKVEREGKGWMWGLVPEVSIEKERRPRRPTPPNLSQGNYYASGPSMFHPPYPYPGFPGQQANGVQTTQAPFVYPPQTGNGMKPQTIFKGANGLPLPLPQANPSATYQSPYTPAQKSTNAQENSGNIKSESSLPIQNLDGDVGSTAPDIGGSTHSDPQSNISSYTAFGQESSNVDVGPTQAQALQTSSSLPAPEFSKNVLDAVNNFKSILTKSMANIPHAEKIVTRAINRTLGIHTPEPGQKEYPEEEAIMGVLQPLVSNIRETERQQMEHWKHEQHPSSAARVQPDPDSNDSASKRRALEQLQNSPEHSKKSVDPSEHPPTEMASSANKPQPTTNAGPVSPTAPPLSPGSPPQSPKLETKSTPSIEGPSETAPSPNSNHLAQSQNSLQSLIEQLTQAPPSTVKAKPETLSAAATDELSHGTKRKLDGQEHSRSLDADGVTSPTDSVDSGMASMENSRAKRVAV